MQKKEALPCLESHLSCLHERLWPHKANTVLPATACKSVFKMWLGEPREGEKQGLSSAIVLTPALFSDLITYPEGPQDPWGIE